MLFDVIARRGPFENIGGLKMWPTRWNLWVNCYNKKVSENLGPEPHFIK